MSAATDRVEALRAELAIAEQEARAERDAAESEMSWEEHNSHMEDFLSEFSVSSKSTEHGKFLTICQEEDNTLTINFTDWDEITHSLTLDPNAAVDFVEQVVGMGILHIPRFHARF